MIQVMTNVKSNENLEKIVTVQGPNLMQAIISITHHSLKGINLILAHV